jgi:putative nucleotidyltransferase with HDIG domain
MDYKQLIGQEVIKIKDKSIVNFVSNAFNSASPKFWVSPCSSSGRFHPPEDNGEGGLIRHLIKASYVTEQFARRAMFSEYELDIARAATILHDICKDGNPWGELTDYRHGIIGAEFLNNFNLEDDFAKTIIKDAVRYHMSPWNT